MKLLRLHTAKVADWDKAGAPRNIWQKIALKSHGVLTPANLASFIGAVLAIYGLVLIVNDEIIKGLIFLSLGRIADLIDGLIAEYTKTKSPLGEIVDVTMDKLVMASTLIVFVAIGLVPWLIVLAIAVQNIANVIISVIGRMRQKRIHPSRYGKLATAFSWAALILYPLGDWLSEDNTVLSAMFILAAIIFFGVYLVIGLQASLSYGHMIYKKARQ